ncbi:MAG: excinuclease ABC subunit UvrA, partial [Saprospiraceae bacterium]
MSDLHSEAQISAPEVAAGAADADCIEVIGARVHNLRNIDVRIPRNKLTVITGVSGSGKSSLAFDTIYAEGQRRFMETLSSYARQFVGNMERPDVEQINGLSPVISIEQKTTGRNPRSTVGTVTEVYDFLRLLFARAGEAYSHVTGLKMVKYTEEQILENVLKRFAQQSVAILAPVVRSRKGHYRELFEQLRKQGYTKVRIDGQMQDLRAGMQTDRYKVHDVEVVIDRLTIAPDKAARLSEDIRTAMRQSAGLMAVLDLDTQAAYPYSRNLMCPESGISYDEPSPNTFSFNSPYGMCPHCKGLGEVQEVDMNAVIPDYSKSINEVGIVPLGEVRDNNLFRELRALSKKYKFSFSTPIRDMPEKALHIILYGGTTETVVASPFTGDEWSYSVAQEGLVNMLKRWYADTGSERMRKWAENFLRVNPCPECDGTRLKKESRWFKIGDKNIAEMAEMDLGALYAHLQNIEDAMSDRQK